MSVVLASVAATRGSGLDFLAQVVNGACIRESPRTPANKETVLNGPRSTPTLQLYTQAQQRGGRQKCPSRFPPGRDSTTCFPSCCLRVQLPISLHLGADYKPPLRTALTARGPPRTKKEPRKSRKSERQL